MSEPSLRPQPDGDVRRPPDIRVGSCTNALAPVSVVERRLEEVRSAARGTDNLLPVLREALNDRCTMGEVCGAMRDVFGEYQPTF